MVFKELTAEQRKKLISRLVSVIISGVLLIGVGAASFAWFSFNVSTSQSGMQISVSNDTADIIIERRREYERLDLNDDPIYSDENIAGLKSVLASKNYDLTETNTADAPLLACELVNETYITNDGVNYYYMRPSAYGTVTFYIHPKDGQDGQTLNFIIKRGCFTDDYDGETPIVSEVVNANVLNLLNGHILFFTGRTVDISYDENNPSLDIGDYYLYSGLIDGEFSYDMSAHPKCDEGGTVGGVSKSECYKVVLYWTWPETYYSIVDPELVGKYPAGIADYISDHPAYFFKGAFDAFNEESKSDAYNDGDQSIGDAADYFTLYLSLA